MLGKLIKNEFKATARTFGLMYLIVLIAAVALKVFMEIQKAFHLENSIIDILGVLTVTVFVLGIIGIIFGTFILILKRFYDSMLKSEGYLSFTLPVTVGQHIASKSIVSYIWILLSGVFIFAMIMLLFLGDTSVFVSLGQELKEMIELVNQHHLWKYVIEVIAVLAVSAYSYIAIGYACFSVGQAWSRSKVAGAFATYIVFSIITQIVSTIGMLVLFGGLDTVNQINMGDAFFEPLMIFVIVQEIVFAVIYTVLTYVMLSRKLNLE